MTLGNSNQSRRRVVGGSLDTSELTQDQVGAMFSDNTETFIAATYQDGDGTIDLVVPVLDEDNLVSDSATDLATQQSIKAYVDGQNHGGGTTVTTGTDTGGADSTASGSYAELTNAPSVSIATGTTCLVLWAMSSDTTGGETLSSIDVSGDTTVAPSDDYPLWYESGAANDAARITAYHWFTGLTEGTNVFTIHTRTGGSGTSTLNRQELTVFNFA